VLGGTSTKIEGENKEKKEGKLTDREREKN
jgi:hypothetical protein